MRILIIGQGVSGTWLSYWLLQQGASVLVIDDATPFTASRVASGVVNPVTGRQVVTTWMAETLLPFAEYAYRSMSTLIHKPLMQRTGIFSFPATEQMMAAYQKKMTDRPCYVHPVEDATPWAAHFHFFHGMVHIDPAYFVDLPGMLDGWYAYLLGQGLLDNASFVPSHLVVEPYSLRYKGALYDLAIDCRGPASFDQNLWGKLPYSTNKGEALIVDIPGLPQGHIYKFGITTLVPWRKGLWWLGSTYDNHYTHPHPTASFRQQMEAFLANTLKRPYTVQDHIAAIRPASIDRRPMAGRHPRYPVLALFNGMGTKGVSLAPWLAKQVAEHLLHEAPLPPAVDIQRFKKAFQ